MRVSSRLETAAFIALTLAATSVLGAAFLWTGAKYRLILHLIMWTPGALALVLMWGLRHEPPRAVGFAFTGWRPWVVGSLYPLGIVAASLGLAYVVRALSGRPDFIVFAPANVTTLLLGRLLQSWSAVGALLGELLLTLLLWFGIAAAYHRGLVNRLTGGRRFILWLPVFCVPFMLRRGYPDLPGELGEEIGWRGYLVRRYRTRPLTAAALTMGAWALFHLPVVFFPAQRAHYIQNAAFLASIAVQATVPQALYLWSRSVWPCAVFHLSWNTWNELVLGDVYGWAPGLFSGQFWVFNGEGPFGLLLNGVVAFWLLRRWRQETERARRQGKL
jgi:hypothetical protein